MREREAEGHSGNVTKRGKGRGRERMERGATSSASSSLVLIPNFFFVASAEISVNEMVLLAGAP